MGFVHLHCHTEYSMLDGITRLKDMAKRSAELNMPACAITDHGYMYGCAQWYLDARKAGIQPIIGCEVYFTDDASLSRERKPRLYHMVLLAKDNTGYVNLMNIVSQAATKGFYYRPRTTLPMLEANHEGIICTSACLAGIIPQNIDNANDAAAMQWARTFQGIFGEDFYMELQDQGINTDSGMTQHELNRRLDALARKLGIKTIATNDFHYLLREHASIQDAMMCVGMGKKISDTDRMRFSNDQFYMKTEEEMRAALGPEFQEACDNTLEIAYKCGGDIPELGEKTSGVYIDFDQIVLPRFPGLKEGETDQERFRAECETGLGIRYGEDWREARPDVVERFEYEYKIICDKGFASYFLIVQDYVRWAKENGIGVGPGRGSAAGALVAYAMDITTFDPLENGLMFERFLSPERVEMPDIDMDFDDERRLEVVAYVRERYGAERVAHVITYSVLKAKQAVNDAARILDYPVSFAQKLSKMISSAPDTTLAATMGEDEKHKDYTSPDFIKEFKENPDAHQIIELARAMEGLTRGEGVHACAVLICRDPLNEHVPTKLDTKGGVEITQYEGHMVADMGLLKMDFLGLRTLTVISHCLKNILKTTGDVIDVDKIPFDDPEIYSLLGGGHTAGVFQVESGGMTATIKAMKPTEYKHMVALIALYRPGPLGAGMVEDYINRMNGRTEVVYYDDRLSDILGETYGTIVYQEQVMQISMKMSGFSAGESDKVRKAVAKKKIKLMTEELTHWEDGNTETMQDHWMNGAVRNGYARETAEKIWADVLKFASYAFNKSHSAGYAILVMQTAWLKAHYPHEFMAATLTSYTGKTEKIVHYIGACRFDGINVLPPDINQSGNDFTPVPEGVRFGLSGIRGVGEDVSDRIVAEREAGGHYKDIFDFLERVDSSCSNRRVVESLIKAGAFDSTGYTRRQLTNLIAKSNPNNLLDAMLKQNKGRAEGQMSIFDMFEDEEDAGSVMDRPAPDGIEWDLRVKLAQEKEALGIYVSDHPLRPYAHALEKARDFGLAQIGDMEDEAAGIYVVPEKKVFSWAGMVEGVTRRATKNGDAMATFTLVDTEANVTCVCFPKVYAAKGRILFGETEDGGEAGDVFVKVRGNLERSDRGDQIMVADLELLDLSEQANKAVVLEVRMHATDLTQAFAGELSSLLNRYPGRDDVELLVEQVDGHALRAELPTHVSAANLALQCEIQDLLAGRGSFVVA